MGSEPPERRSRGDAYASPRAEVTSTLKSGPSVRRVASWASSLLSAAAPRGKGSVSILLCGDARMRRLNRQFRKIDRPTDVLSFPAGEPSFFGDIAVDVTFAARQASRRGHSLDREVQLLLAHGVLHLLGHDHETDDGAMFRLQRQLVRKVFGPGPDGVPQDEA